MISCIFNRKDADRRILDSVGPTFEAYYKPEWFEGELSVKILKETSHAEYIGGFAFRLTDGEVIPPEYLAGSTKNLFLMLFREDLRRDYIFCQAKLGNNCAKWLQMIGEMYDFTIYYAYPMEFDSDRFAKIPIKNYLTGELYYSDNEFFFGYMKGKKYT